MPQGINAAGFGYAGIPEAGSNTDVDTGAEQLTTTSSNCRAVVVQADPDNTDHVLLGDVNNQTIQLEPGDSITLPVRDPSIIYVQGGSNNQTVNYLLIL